MSIRPTAVSDELYQYILKVSLREDPILKELREQTASMSVGKMQISPDQGQFMALLVKLMRAKRTIEIGVFTGYSSTVVAMALPKDGKVVACDINAEWTKLAQATWEKAGIAHKIDFCLGPALETLQILLDQGEESSFDFAFIDADKQNTSEYYECCLQLIRKGGVIAIDNTLREGNVINPDDQRQSVTAVRDFNEQLHSDDRVDISLVPIADGLTLAMKR